MKASHPRITLLGNNSGRNLGDAAILSSILEHLSQELEQAEFFVPSISPKWITKHYGSTYNVRPLDVMPWTGSIRLLGLPTLMAFAKSDVALICDGIIFGKKLLNPAFNYLITLVFLAPLAKLFNCKLICFNCGIGPFPSALSRWCAKYVMNSADSITLRDQDSLDLAREVGVTVPVELSGDSAFINPVSPPDRATAILREKDIEASHPLLGINITSYIDSWLSADERVGSHQEFADTVVSGVRQAVAGMKTAPHVVLFSTQPMDEAFSKSIATRLNAGLITNTEYSSHEIQAVMRHCGLLIGMRFHSLVLASAVGVPVVGLVYAPKVKSLMKLYQSDKYCLALKNLSANSLASTLVDAWENRDSLRAAQQSIVGNLKVGAQRAGKELVLKYFPKKRQANVDQAEPQQRQVIR